MKNRYIPFGYEMINGKIEIHPGEAETVRRIYSDYLGGAALQEIADRLAKESIEIFPGICDWNKHRVKRILEDVRYAGDSTYPQLITADIQNQAQEIKGSRYTCNRCPKPSSTEHKSVYAVTYCADCESRVFHRLDTRNKYPEAWTCQNPECRHITKFTTEALLNEITDIFNRIIGGEVKITDSSSSETPMSLEVRRTENEIERILGSLSVDKDEVKNMILQCAAKKYACIKSARHITEKLKADFEKSSPLSDFNTELFGKTVAQILIDGNGNISLKLKNEQIIGKEQHHADTNA